MGKAKIVTSRLDTPQAPILSKRAAKKRYMKLPRVDRLYPTVAEEREYRRLKEKYGL